MDNQFLVSVANVLLLDPASNDAVIAYGKTLLDSSIKGTIESQDVRGGKGNKKVFEYKHSRNLELTLNSATFRYDFLAMQAGATIISGAANAYVFDECITLSAGSEGTVAKTPIGTVYAIAADGAIYSATPAAKVVTFAIGIASETVSVFYKTSEANTDLFTIGSTTTPKIVKAILEADVFDNTQKIGTLQITVPRLQLNGEIDISLTPNGVASTPFGGTALAYQATACGDPVYADVLLVRSSDTVVFTGIAASPAETDVGVGDTVQLQVWGLRGPMFAPVLIDPADCTFTSSVPAKATVGEHTGILTGVATGDTVVTVDYTGLPSDTVNVTCVA
jgi:hypothetical protein